MKRLLQGYIQQWIGSQCAWNSGPLEHKHTFPLRSLHVSKRIICMVPSFRRGLEVPWSVTPALRFVTNWAPVDSSIYRRHKVSETWMVMAGVSPFSLSFWTVICSSYNLNRKTVSVQGSNHDTSTRLLQIYDFMEADRSLISHPSFVSVLGLSPFVFCKPLYN